MCTGNDSTPISRQRLEQCTAFEYRARVVARLGVTVEWRALTWTDRAACADRTESTPGLRGRCPVAAECLAAAITTDDTADWRGSLSRSDREHLWAAMERTYCDICDLELMRMDAARLPRRPVLQRLDQRHLNGQRS